MKRFSVASIAISLVSMILTAYHNYILVQLYRKATGKNKALFLEEILRLDRKIYIGLGLLISMVLIVMAKKKNENVNLRVLAFVLFCMASIFLFMRPWIYFR
jgi:hypothetical protein